MPLEAPEPQLLRGKGPLRILAVLANPQDQEELDLERELAVVQESLSGAAANGLVEFDHLEHATVSTLIDCLEKGRYHIVHFAGHASSINKPGLCLESDSGASKLVGAEELSRLLFQGGVKLCVLSGCQTAKAPVDSAADSFAAQVVLGGISAVVAMQARVSDDSAIEMARVFYSELSAGAFVGEALQHSREALYALDQRRPPQLRRFDWGVPTLYRCSLEFRAIKRGAERERYDRQSDRAPRASKFPGSRPFVGRWNELRTLRQAVQQPATVTIVRGLPGIGKSALATHLVDRPGAALQGALRIDCSSVRDSSIIMREIGALVGQSSDRECREAAKILFDDTVNERARLCRVVKRIRHCRYLIVFDNLDSWFEPLHSRARPIVGTIADEGLRTVLKVLLDSNIDTIFLFTSRYRWDQFEKLEEPRRRQIVLSELGPRQAMQLVSTFPILNEQQSAQNTLLLEYFGGHPGMLGLVNDRLAQGLPEREPPAERFGDLFMDCWKASSLDGFLSALQEHELEALEALTVLVSPVSMEFCSTLIHPRSVAGNMNQELVAHLCELYVLHAVEHGTEQGQNLVVPRCVRHWMNSGLCLEKLRQLHLNAADCFGRGFVDEAERFLSRKGLNESREEIERFAAAEVVATHVRSALGSQREFVVMNQALMWSEHLHRAGKYELSATVSGALIDALIRVGQQRLAEALLRRNIASLDGVARDAAKGNLANLLANEGSLEPALSLYRELLRSPHISESGQLATCLSGMALAYLRKGNNNEAMRQYEAALGLSRESEDQPGQASILHQLSYLYMWKGHLARALECSLESEALFKSNGKTEGALKALHAQGEIFVRLGRLREAFDSHAEVYRVSEIVSHREGMGIALREMAKLYLRADDFEMAVSSVRQSMEISKALGSHVEVAHCLCVMGDIYGRQGEFEAAKASYGEALDLYEIYGSSENADAARRDLVRIEKQLLKRG